MYGFKLLGVALIDFVELVAYAVHLAILVGQGRAGDFHVGEVIDGESLAGTHPLDIGRDGDVGVVEHKLSHTIAVLDLHADEARIVLLSGDGALPALERGCGNGLLVVVAHGHELDDSAVGQSVEGSLYGVALCVGDDGKQRHHCR